MFYVMAEIDPQKILAAPVAEFATSVAIGIAQAQTALDQAALALWKQVDSDPALKDLKEIGYQPTWYTIPLAEAEIKLTFYFESTQSSASRRMFVLPFNAKTQIASKLTEQGTSQLKLKIVPTPPPPRISVQKP
jgi:hypothetical protein